MKRKKLLIGVVFGALVVIWVGRDLYLSRKWSRYFNSPVKKIDFWANYKKGAIEEKIFEAPNELLDYLNLDNQYQNIKNIPQKFEIDRELKEDFIKAIQELPKSVQDKANGKLVGIFLVSDLGGTGYTDVVKDRFGRNVGAFMVFDGDVLSQLSANDWASWKESTPFKDSELKIVARIESDEDNSRKNAIQYILLHELGHVVSVGENIDPGWSHFPNEAPRGYRFFDFSWKFKAGKGPYYSRYDQAGFFNRKYVRYYFGARLNGDQMVETYRQLEKTNFPTLYAATSPGDDWAESFVSYVHTEIMKKPFSLEIKSEDRVIFTYKSCWVEKRCEAKKKFLEHYFSN